MTCRTTHGEHALKTDSNPVPHFRCQVDPGINIDQNEGVKETGERKELPELRGRDRGRPPILKKKKSSYDLRDIFQTQEAASSSASSSPATSNVSSPVIPSPGANKIISPDEIICAPNQQQQTTTPCDRESLPHDKNVLEDRAYDASTSTFIGRDHNQNPSPDTVPDSGLIKLQPAASQ
ncbi:hypothetical protein BDR03DRAFT_943766 [Suillus americanus]|nr:hypothetical protein BDR03DRAFT_943766 [Suillus americanus]